MKFFGNVQFDEDLVPKKYVDGGLNTKQDTLVSGTNIKTVNGESLLGEGSVDTAEAFEVRGKSFSEISDAAASGKKLYYNSTPIISFTNVDEQELRFVIIDSDTDDPTATYLSLYIQDTEGPALHETSYSLISSFDYSPYSERPQNGVAVSQALESIANPSESVTFNSDGQLVVGGRLGQFPNGGVYYPTNIAPTGVGSSSFLMTDGAKEISIAQRTFAIMAGANITCKSTAAGSTTYRVSNTQANRFTLAAVIGGRAALSQSDAAANGTADITSITFANGGSLTTPYFGDTESSNDIIVTLARSINPSAATTQIRVYGKNNATDNILVGQGVGANGGKVISLGQSTYAGGNQNIAIGNSVYVNANNSVGMGHTIFINKQYCFGVGQGHDFTNGANGTAAVGTWSNISARTKFAVGDGTAYNARSNIFEVQNNRGATEMIVKSPNGTRFKITVSDSGEITATAV